MAFKITLENLSIWQEMLRTVDSKLEIPLNTLLSLAGQQIQQTGRDFFFNAEADVTTHLQTIYQGMVARDAGASKIPEIEIRNQNSLAALERSVRLMGPLPQLIPSDSSAVFHTLEAIFTRIGDSPAPSTERSYDRESLAQYLNSFFLPKFKMTSLEGQYTYDEKNVFWPALMPGKTDPRHVTLTSLDKQISSADSHAQKLKLWLTKAFLHWNDFLNLINSSDFYAANSWAPDSVADATRAIDALAKAQAISSNEDRARLQPIVDRWQHITRLHELQSKAATPTTIQERISAELADLGIFYLAYRAAHKAAEIDLASDTLRLSRLRAEARHLLLHAHIGGQSFLASGMGGPDRFSFLYLGIAKYLGDLQLPAFKITEGAVDFNEIFAHQNTFKKASGKKDPRYPYPLRTDFFESLGIFRPCRISLPDEGGASIVNNSSLTDAEKIDHLLTIAATQSERAIQLLYTEDRDHLAGAIQHWTNADNALIYADYLNPHVEITQKLQLLHDHWKHIIPTLENVWYDLQKIRQKMGRIHSIEEAKHAFKDLKITTRVHAQTMKKLGFKSYADRIALEPVIYEAILDGRDPFNLNTSMNTSMPTLLISGAHFAPYSPLAARLPWIH